MLNTVFELYNKLLNMYKPQYDKLTKAQRERIKVQNMPEDWSIDLYLDKDEGEIPPALELEGTKEITFEPEETIAERVKLIPRKRKTAVARLKILYQHNKITKKVYNDLIKSV